jgi:hypothetical protein
MIFSGLSACLSFTLSSEEGMGGDRFHIRYLHRHTPGGHAHLPDFESISRKTIKLGLLLLLYHFLQLIHLLTHPNLGHVENPTKELELVT